MKAVAEKSKNQNQIKAVANTISHQKSIGQDGLNNMDNRVVSVSQAGLQLMISNSPRMIAQRKQINSMMGNTLLHIASGQEKHLPHEAALKGDNRGDNNTIQRLIVNAGKDTLLDEAKKPSGWITLSTLDVGITLDTSKKIAELDEVDGLGKIGKSENIFIVGHGSEGKMAHTEPNVLAAELKKVLPTGWAGMVIGLTCNAGKIPSKGGKSGTKKLSEEMGGATVVGAEGQTFSHVGIKNMVRVLKNAGYTGDVRKYYLTEMSFSPAEKKQMLSVTFPQHAGTIGGWDDRTVSTRFSKLYVYIDTAHSDVKGIIDTKDLSILSERAQGSRAIDVAHIDLNTKWTQYMATEPSNLKTIAKMATELSADFYKLVVEHSEMNALLFNIGTGVAS